MSMHWSILCGEKPARESIALITARTPKKRKPAKADPEIAKEVQEILKALLSSRLMAVPTSAILQPALGVIGSEARASEDTLLDSSQGVEVPRLVPEEAMESDGQPDEEEITETPQNLNIANAVKAKAWDALGILFNGNIWVNENNAGKLCILCGSPDHVFAECHADDQLRQQITLAFDLVRSDLRYVDILKFFAGSSTTSWRESVRIQRQHGRGKCRLIRPKTESKGKTKAEATSPSRRNVHREV